jgi:hypothetical protein
MKSLQEPSEGVEERTRMAARTKKRTSPTREIANLKRRISRLKKTHDQRLMRLEHFSLSILGIHVGPGGDEHLRGCLVEKGGTCTCGAGEPRTKTTEHRSN